MRCVNGAGNTFYDVRIPGLKMTVVQADGVDVEAVSVDEFRFGPGETYDVIVEPKDEAYTIFAQSMDRSGYARGTLAVREGVSANAVSYTHLDVYKRQTTLTVVTSASRKNCSCSAPRSAACRVR